MEFWEFKRISRTIKPVGTASFSETDHGGTIVPISACASGQTCLRYAHFVHTVRDDRTDAVTARPSPNGILKRCNCNHYIIEFT